MSKREIRNFIKQNGNVKKILGDDAYEKLVKSYYDDALKGDKRAKKFFLKLLSPEKENKITITPPETMEDVNRFCSELMKAIGDKTLSESLFEQLLKTLHFKADLIAREESLDIIEEKLGKESR